VLLALACGGEREADPAGISDPGALRGRTVGVTSLESVAALETRFLLQEGYALNVSVPEGDVAFVESPADSLVDMLADGAIDAAVLPPHLAFALLDDERFRILSHVSKEVHGLVDRPVTMSVLVTYADLATSKSSALEHLRSLLAESLAYFSANQDHVLDAVGEAASGEGFPAWQAARQKLRLGDRSPDVQSGLVRLWRMAQTLGDIKEYPDLEQALADGDAEGPDEVGDRATLSLAVLDDPSRRAALYAIEQAIVASDALDLDIAYLGPSALAEAAAARQYDVIEASPLLVASAAAGRLDLLVVSGCVEDLDSTLLFVRAGV
jgi:hypothetical protein